MTKIDIITRMVNIAERYNLEAIRASGMDQASIETMMLQNRGQLFKIQGEILDTLVKEGIVTINDVVQ